MSLYEKHVFVCTSDSACGRDGDAVGVQKTLKRLVAARSELKGRIRVNQSGCLNQCGHGPMVVVYPEAVWYWEVTAEKAQRIVDEHIVAGVPVEPFRYHAAPGDHKLPRDADDRITADPCHPDRIFDPPSSLQES